MYNDTNLLYNIGSNIVILIFVLYNVQRITREISKKLLLNFRVVIF